MKVRDAVSLLVVTSMFSSSGWASLPSQMQYWSKFSFKKSDTFFTVTSRPKTSDNLYWGIGLNATAAKTVTLVPSANDVGQSKPGEYFVASANSSGTKPNALAATNSSLGISFNSVTCNSGSSTITFNLVGGSGPMNFGYYTGASSLSNCPGDLSNYTFKNNNIFDGANSVNYSPGSGTCFYGEYPTSLGDNYDTTAIYFCS